MGKIRPANGICFQKLKSIFGLSLALAKAEFKLRNEGSFFGVFWYLLNPILTFILLFLVFNDRLGNGIPNYALYLLLGIIMFNFFQGATIESTKTIDQNRWLIKSINFPRESLVLSIVIKNLFSHFFEIIIFSAAILFFKTSLVGIFYYFILLVFFCFFIFGVSLILSALTVYFIDFENIWNFAVRLLWLGTPIFYSISGQARLLFINMFNPMYYFIETARDITIYGKIPENFLLFGALASALLFLFIGLFLFTKLKDKFSELV